MSRALGLENIQGISSPYENYDLLVSAKRRISAHFLLSCTVLVEGGFALSDGPFPLVTASVSGSELEPEIIVLQDSMRV